MGNAQDDFLHAAMARDEMAPLGDDWAEIIGYDAVTQQYETSILRGGTGDHSDYRLMFPKKGYWLWMTDSAYFTIPVSHTYYCSAEWVSDYPPPESDLLHSEDDAKGFFNTLKYSTYWSGNSPGFVIGDDNGYAKAIHWMDPIYGGQDHDYIDETNFAYFSGHGWEGGILFGYGATRQEQELWYYETVWGNTRVDWVALASCHTLDQSIYGEWKDSFQGLHSIVGWDTTGYGDDDMGLLFATYMKSPYKKSVWEAWQLAADYCVNNPGYRIAILAIDIDGNLNTRECVDDHIYGQGKSWFSPQGNPEPAEFVYYSEPCEP